MDAITGTDETAYKSLDVGKRDTVVKNVLRWERSQIGEYLKIFFQGDWPQQNRSDLPCRVQANGDQVGRYQDRLSKVVLSDIAKNVQSCAKLHAPSVWCRPPFVCLTSGKTWSIYLPGRPTSSTTSGSDSKLPSLQTAPDICQTNFHKLNLPQIHLLSLAM